MGMTFRLLHVERKHDPIVAGREPKLRSKVMWFGGRLGALIGLTRNGQKHERFDRAGPIDRDDGPQVGDVPSHGQPHALTIRRVDDLETTFRQLA